MCLVTSGRFLLAFLCETKQQTVRKDIDLKDRATLTILVLFYVHYSSSTGFKYVFENVFCVHVTSVFFPINSYFLNISKHFPTLLLGKSDAYPIMKFNG
jgi:hypothetical protein